MSSPTDIPVSTDTGIATIPGIILSSLGWTSGHHARVAYDKLFLEGRTFSKYWRSWESSLNRPYSRIFVPARAGEIVVSPHTSISLTPRECRKSTRGSHI